MNKIRKLYQIDHIHHQGITGFNVVTAVLDTGCYPHMDLSEKIIYFKDFTKDNNKPYDDNSHGSHVSGIIAGTGKASKGLYKGIAPDSSIISLKVLGKNGHGESENIIRAIDWIANHKTEYNIRIVNISIGTKALSCSDESSLLVKAVDGLWDLGITVIASAGNNGPDKMSITTPGISRKIITVGSGTLYSGKGPTLCDIPKPDIIAPGNSITSCGNGNDFYMKKSGTSMSTPIVSGAVALAFSKNKSLSNNDIKFLLCQSASNIGLDRYSQGCGMLNIKKLLLIC